MKAAASATKHALTAGLPVRMRAGSRHCATAESLEMDRALAVRLLPDIQSDSDIPV